MVRSIMRYLNGGVMAVMLLHIPGRAAGVQASRNGAAPKSNSAGARAEKEAAPGQQKHERELNAQETQCIVDMLRAPSLGEAETLKGKCIDSFTLRAAYASLLVKFQAPNADREVIRNLPTNAAEMDQLYSLTEAQAPDYATSLVQGQAYERFYRAIFRIVTARPGLLPRFFAIAARFGSTNPDNVDEDVWFCEELKKLHHAMPKVYMRAARSESNPVYKSEALGCRNGPVE